jgi:hypothetical protein
MKKLLAYSLITATLLGGCNAAEHVPRETVFVPDISQSIDAGAERQMFTAIEDVAMHMHRGDTLTIIPITGDAESELQGRTLHYSVPSAEVRQAYDADLRALSVQIKDDLARLRADAVAHSGKHTDIIGSIRVAKKEFSNRPTDKRLVVLSDFIQDDKQLNFRIDPHMANEADAVALGEAIALPEANHPKVSIILGRLKSNEFSALSPTRQRAINAFWAHVMSPAVVDPDGTAAVLRRAPTK